MTELERKALLGDREAQRICTEQGIVLPCPCCGRTVDWDFESEMVCHKCTDCILGGKMIPLSQWNTRPAPPVGRCKECQHYVAEWVGDGETIPAECIHPLTGLFVVDDDDFCSYFEPKGDERNA